MVNPCQPRDGRLCPFGPLKPDSDQSARPSKKSGNRRAESGDVEFRMKRALESVGLVAFDEKTRSQGSMANALQMHADHVSESGTDYGRRDGHGTKSARVIEKLGPALNIRSRDLPICCHRRRPAGLKPIPRPLRPLFTALVLHDVFSTRLSLFNKPCVCGICTGWRRRRPGGFSALISNFDRSLNWALVSHEPHHAIPSRET